MYAKCPRCNEVLDYIGTYTSGTYGDVHYEFVWGECPKCNQRYKWTECYKFDGIEDLEEE